MSNFWIVKTEEDHEDVLARINEIMDAKPGTPQMDELELLTSRVETYEEEHYPMDNPEADEHVAMHARIEALEANCQRLVQAPDERQETIERLQHELIYERERAAGLQSTIDRLHKQELEPDPYRQRLAEEIDKRATAERTLERLQKFFASMAGLPPTALLVRVRAILDGEA